MPNKNPSWTRDELILALDLYFRANPLRTTADDPAVRELSDLLNTLPFHPRSERQQTFRNPTGVYMTLRTFLKWDTSYPGKGLDGGRLGKKIWDEFSNDRQRLGITAKAIRIATQVLSSTTPAEDFDDDEGFPEGRILSQLHVLRERNLTLVRKKKDQVFRKTGRLECEVCGFDFHAVYGLLGTGFAECHHRKPLAALPAERVSRTTDLAIVCSNCHRILHRTRPWLSVEDLRSRLITRGTSAAL